MRHVAMVHQLTQYHKNGLTNQGQAKRCSIPVIRVGEFPTGNPKPIRYRLKVLICGTNKTNDIDLLCFHKFSTLKATITRK